MVWGGFHEGFDGDIAVKGLSGEALHQAAAMAEAPLPGVEALHQAAAMAEAHLPGVEVELLALEELSAGFRS